MPISSCYKDYTVISGLLLYFWVYNDPRKLNQLLMSNGYHNVNICTCSAIQNCLYPTQQLLTTANDVSGNFKYDRAGIFAESFSNPS